ncbi:hypothetical protein [Enterococcus faecalis]|uniref:hypothetical protein n=1 Tax=Enterococcus faecalis TaxID=1351 RepID=UPI00297149F0|nr:hypothetical protein [Enterococcus faecalis]HAP3805359.1 hypothetical protein [Enterococcus faecalis]
MKKEYDYEHMYNIETISELSMGVIAKLITFLCTKKMDIKRSNDFFAILYQQFKMMHNLDLFDLNEKELKYVSEYWDKMNKLVDKIKKDSEI